MRRANKKYDQFFQSGFSEALPLDYQMKAWGGFMPDQNTSKAGTKIQLSDIRGPEFRQAFDAFLGFDLRLLVTIRDLVIHPIHVARDALNDSKGTYLGQVRLFIFIFGLTAIFLSLTKLYDAITIEGFFNNREDLISGYTALIAENGFEVEQVNAAIKGWTNLLISPINLVFTVIIALFFKIIAPKITYLGHVLLYIIANNASSIIGMPLTVLAVKIGLPMPAAAFFPMVIQFFYLSVFVWFFMRETVAGGILKLFLLALAFLVATLIISLFMQLIIHILAHNQFGASPFEYLIRTAIENAQTTQASP
jgi:hypothetical protein